MTDCIDFKLYFEHHENCPMIEAEKRCKQERRDLIKWARKELGLALMVLVAPKRRPRVTSNK